MNILHEIEQLKQIILSGQETNKEKSVDRLIELEGMKSMDFFQSIFLKNSFHREKETIELHNIAGYAVRQLMALRAKESKSDFKFCPFCASELFEYSILDPYMTGLKCPNNHCFHIEVQHGECKDKTLHTKNDKRLILQENGLLTTLLERNIKIKYFFDYFIHF